MMKMYLAFYRGRKKDNPRARWMDRLICLIDGGKYSHVELAIETKSGLYKCFSSSNRDGGVRKKKMSLPNDVWQLVAIPAVSPHDWMHRNIGKEYDWCGLLRTVLPWWPHSRRRWFCAEMCADIIGLKNPARYGVQALYRWALANAKNNDENNGGGLCR